MQQLNILVTEAQFQRLDQYCYRKRLKKNVIVRELIEQFLKEIEENEPHEIS